MLRQKRGQGLSTNAIILIVLGVVVLVILIAGFTMGWRNVAPWLSSENVGTIVTSCDTSCSTNNVYAFCSKDRELVDSEKKKVKTTCVILAEVSDFSKYAIDECSSIDCELLCSDLKINDKQGAFVPKVTVTNCADIGNKGVLNRDCIPERGCKINQAGVCEDESTTSVFKLCANLPVGECKSLGCDWDVINLVCLVGHQKVLPKIKDAYDVTLLAKNAVDEACAILK